VSDRLKLWFNYPHSLTINEEYVIGGTVVYRVIAHRDTETRTEIEVLIVLDQPPNGLL
jgi:hypothetical protein